MVEISKTGEDRLKARGARRYAGQVIKKIYINTKSGGCVEYTARDGDGSRYVVALKEVFI